MPEKIDINAYIVYTRASYKDREVLEKYLSILKLQGYIHYLADREIVAGETWEPIIGENIVFPDLILVLLDNEIVDSGYFQGDDYDRIRSLARMGKLDLLFIIISDCNWEPLIPGETIIILPEGGKPISDPWWEYKASVYNQIFKALKSVIKKRKKKKPVLLFDTLITTLSQVHGIRKTLQTDENSRNTVVSLLLQTRGFRAYDQTLSGSSESEIRLAQLDIRIEDEKGHAVSIIEALNLDSLNTTVIDRYVWKLFHQYDCSGLKENYIVVYSSAKDFKGLCKKYREHLQQIDYESYPLLKDGIEEVPTGFNKIAAFRAHHRCNKGETILYHILVEM
ncbi:MAG: hypothetical protein NT166_24535 [Candidatus Aminicenantes bacterium]|nr:hypothetical protein [Candidatus Aminicenantes bacterium]